MKRRYVVLIVVFLISLGSLAFWVTRPGPPLDLAGQLEQVIQQHGFQPLALPVADLRPGDIHPQELTWRGCWDTEALRSPALGGLQRTLSYDRRGSVRTGIRLLRQIGMDLGVNARRVHTLRFRMDDWTVTRTNGLGFVWDRPDCWRRVTRQDSLDVVGGTLTVGSIRVEALDENGQEITSAVVGELPGAPRVDSRLDGYDADRRLLSGDSLVVGFQPHPVRIARFECTGAIPAAGRFVVIGGCPTWHGAPEPWYRVAVEADDGGASVRLRLQEVGAWSTGTVRVEAEIDLETTVVSHFLRHDRIVVTRAAEGYGVAIHRYEVQPQGYVGFQMFATVAADTVAPVDIEESDGRTLAIRLARVLEPADSAVGAATRPLPDDFVRRPFTPGGDSEAVIGLDDIQLLCHPDLSVRRSPELCSALISLRSDEAG